MMKTHSFHPVPLLVNGEFCDVDDTKAFSESECLRGSIGTIYSEKLMGLLLANAGKLNRARQPSCKTESRTQKGCEVKWLRVFVSLWFNPYTRVVAKNCGVMRNMLASRRGQHLGQAGSRPHRRRGLFLRHPRHDPHGERRRQAGARRAPQPTSKTAYHFMHEGRRDRRRQDDRDQGRRWDWYSPITGLSTTRSRSKSGIDPTSAIRSRESGAARPVFGRPQPRRRPDRDHQRQRRSDVHAQGAARPGRVRQRGRARG